MLAGRSFGSSIGEATSISTSTKIPQQSFCEDLASRLQRMSENLTASSLFGLRTITCIVNDSQAQSRSFLDRVCEALLTTLNHAAWRLLPNWAIFLKEVICFDHRRDVIYLYSDCALCIRPVNSYHYFYWSIYVAGRLRIQVVWVCPLACFLDTYTNIAEAFPWISPPRSWNSSLCLFHLLPSISCKPLNHQLEQSSTELVLTYTLGSRSHALKAYGTDRKSSSYLRSCTFGEVLKETENLELIEAGAASHKLHSKVHFHIRVRPRWLRPVYS